MRAVTKSRDNNLSRTGSAGRFDNQRLHFDYRTIASLKIPERELRVLPQRVKKKLEKSIHDFGAVMPAVIGADGTIYVGADVVAAAKRVGLTEFPTVLVTHLDDHQLRLYRVAHDKVTEGSSWDYESLRLEFSEISAERPDLDLGSSGFEIPERDYIYGHWRANDKNDLDDQVAMEGRAIISEPGDVWLLGRHILVCGDATDPEVISTAVDGGVVRAMVSDLPYNVKIKNNVSGKGEVVHEEFAQASGELSQAEFTAFLKSAIGAAESHVVDGGLFYLFMDWRHLMELCQATSSYDLTQLNLLVWAKSKAAQGSFYRSAHELVGLFKKGKAPHINNIDLGRHGRSRSNVISMPGVNVFGKGRKKALETHPTVKPVGLILDFILDCSAPGDRILDPFGGSGTALIAAEKSDRVASLVEIEPKFVDATIRRFEALTGERAKHRDTGLDFEALGKARTEGDA